MAGYTTKLLIFTLDVLSAVLSLYFAILLTHNFDGESTGSFLSWGTGVLIGTRIAAYIIFGTNSLIIRYIGEKDIKHVFLAVTSSSLLFLLFLQFFPGAMDLDNTVAVLLVDYLLLLLFCVAMRILLRIGYDQYRLQKSSRINTAIFGAGELGALVERVLRQYSSHNYKAVAFFDDNPRVHLKRLNGIRIYNPRKTFKAVIKKYDIKVAIIGINRLPEERRVEFINACLEQKVKVLKIQPAELWIKGGLDIAQLTNINFEDLLSRPPIRLDEEEVKASITGKVVLVTGCAGSIGSEIVRQLLRFRPQLIVGLDHAETPLAELSLSLKEHPAGKVFQGIVGDVKDHDKLFHIFQEYQPDYVFHAAAYKHVPIMERFPEEAVKSNVLGTKQVADLAVQFGVHKFVMISTDKVVNPGNVMGASKRIAEIYVQSLNFRVDNKTQFITTRFGNVLGSNGSVIPIFKDQIRRRQPVTVTHPDVTRFFMTIPEACQLVLEAGAMGNGGEIFVFDMGEPVRILDLARKMVLMAGLTPDEDVKIEFTGLRPGEKLTEELLDKQEGILATHHPKICRAMVRTYDYEQVKPHIEDLIEAAAKGCESEILVKRMKEIVPEFSSRNSIFSELDK